MSNALQYVALPYMMDPVHPDDTLFIVAEGDFRFYRADCEGEQANMDLEAAVERARRTEIQERALQVPPQTDVQPLPGSTDAAGSASRQEDAAQAAQDAAEWQDHVELEEGVQSEFETREGCGLPLFEPRLKPSHKLGRERPEPTPELEDIVCLCNAAARLGRGNLVWLGWNATPDKRWKVKHPERIANGSQLLGITSAGARWLQPRLEARV